MRQDDAPFFSLSISRARHFGETDTCCRLLKNLWHAHSPQSLPGLGGVLWRPQRREVFLEESHSCNGVAPRE